MIPAREWNCPWKNEPPLNGNERFSSSPHLEILLTSGEVVIGWYERYYPVSDEDIFDQLFYVCESGVLLDLTEISGWRSHF